MSNYLQFRFRQQPYLFQFKIGFTLLWLFFFILFCLLGIWQLHRYTYKKNLLSSVQHINVVGHYLNKSTMLLQNQFHQGQLGFDVLTPLQIAGEKKILLVDRGWIQKPASQIPHIDKVSGEQHITGYIKLLGEYQFILGENILNPNAPTIVMQKIDIDELSRITHLLFYPYILRLDPSQAHGFVREWVISTMPPGQHMAYAVQWFLMAIAVLIAYFCFCVRRESHANE